MKILIINAGSSSLKYQFMESEGGQGVAKGLCERIGIDGRLTHKVPGREDVVREIPMPTHSEAIQSVLDIMVDPVNGVIASTDEIAAVGIANQRETAIVWDRFTGKPVYNAIVWQCRRTSEM